MELVELARSLLELQTSRFPYFIRQLVSVQAVLIKVKQRQLDFPEFLKVKLVDFNHFLAFNSSEINYNFIVNYLVNLEFGRTVTTI